MKPLQVDKLTINSILIYDAVNVFARTLKGLSTSGKISTEPLKCMNSPFTSWSNGFKLINFMRVVSIPFRSSLCDSCSGQYRVSVFRPYFLQIETEGLSGLLRFDDKTGHRSYFTLEMVELVDTGFKKIGLWDPEKGMTYTRTSSEMLRDLYVKSTNKTFIVSTKIVSYQVNGQHGLLYAIFDLFIPSDLLNGY